jgi:hypothetical protein
MLSQFWFYVSVVQLEFNSEFVHCQRSKCQNCVKFKQTRKPHNAACQNYVQSKQPRKPHKAAEERHLAPLELRHSDICEMNGVLTGSG